MLQSTAFLRDTIAADSFPLSPHLSRRLKAKAGRTAGAETRGRPLGIFRTILGADRRCHDPQGPVLDGSIASVTC